jgi:hypothetical protein
MLFLSKFSLFIQPIFSLSKLFFGLLPLFLPLSNNRLAVGALGI